MREIKFRAWLPGINKMTYTHSLEELMGFNVGILEYGAVEWMQYTGLKDRNGKEIYEGDIMDYFTYVYSDERRKGIVCFDANKCCYKIVPFDMYVLNAGNGGWTGHAFDSVICSNSEVIGNIHQNKELIT